jgi:NADH:ubiquinone oxidoreductase subunit 6 (subunit J)
MRNEEICILVFILFIQVVSFFQPDSHPWYMVWLPALVCAAVVLLCFIIGLISIIITARAKRAEMLKIPEKKE